jgi:hypothetical protein
MTAGALYATRLKSTLHLENLYVLEKKDRQFKTKAVDTRGEWYRENAVHTRKTNVLCRFAASTNFDGDKVIHRALDYCDI